MIRRHDRARGATGPGRPRRLRALACAVLVLASGAGLAMAAAACGSVSSQVSVRLFSGTFNDDPATEENACFAPPADNGASAAGGGKLDYTLILCNVGPGDANGVHASVDLPADVHYEATTGIERDIVGSVRLVVTDPQPRATTPTWGNWHLDGPSVNADGSRRIAFVAVHFTVSIGGTPGNYKVQPSAATDASDGDIAGPASSLEIQPSSDLHVLLSVVPTTVSRGGEVLYRVTVDNLGTGPAKGVNLLVVLATGLQFVKTESIGGNSGRSHPVDPTTGALAAYYGGFNIPARSDVSPGSLQVTLRARCVFCTGGTFTARVQLSDSEGLVLTIAKQAPIAVSAPGSVEPTPSPTFSPPPLGSPLPTTPVPTPSLATPPVG